ncbi:unnamed protein product [Mytilus coruscus]|uniref:Uncharacterized protein n=1 Tax=Mytilus coruscus TaxID=42192 RepID=A0A6J8D509_MYTCO|nr:unnamed protein product [Mytilus coruscus]
MASSTRRTGCSRNRQHPYNNEENATQSSQWDMENLENWTGARFRDELRKLGINIPKSWSKTVLKQLYLDNKERLCTDEREGATVAADDHIRQPRECSDHQGIHVDSNLGYNRSVRPNMPNKLDKQGRSRVFSDGKEVCNNYNNVRGCFRTTCNLLHACSTCRSTGHPAPTCTGNRQNHHNVHVPQKYSQTYKNSTSSKDFTQTKPDNKS